MQYIKEYAFWNKDNKLGDKILRNLSLLNPEDITYEYVSRGYSGGPKYTFHLKDFLIICKRESDEHDNFLQGYSVIVDGVKLDISGIQARKILKKVKEIYERPKKEDDEYIRKDLDISLESKMEEGLCDMCGDPVYDDNRLCLDCREGRDEIKVEVEPKKQNVYIPNPGHGTIIKGQSQNIYYL